MPTILAVATFLLLSIYGHSQVPLIMPIPEQQFFTPTGTVCSGCFLYTQVSGSSTPQVTYTDATGLVPNTNPIVLNSAGFPQTSIGTQVGVWLSPTLTYRIVLQNSAHVVLYTVDGITGQLPGSLSGPLSILQITCPQITIGTTPNFTNLCFPAPSGAITLTFPATTDTLVGRATTDTLSNKTLTTPLFNGTNCGITNGPGIYVCIANANPTGTTTSTLTTLINTTSQATIATNTTTTGIIGICVAACGSSGTATIEQAGTLPCIFDGATTANHYISPSSTVGGDCHDAGPAPATGVQVIGQVLTTNGGAGTYQINLFPPGLITPINNPLILPNDTTTGTLLNGLVKQAASLSSTTTAIRTATSDNADVIGIVNSGAGLSGNATIQQIGLAQCVFDGATTVNDWFIPSVTTAGNCHDTGVAYSSTTFPPQGSQILGQVLSTNVAGGTYSVNLYGPSVLRPVSIYAPQSASTAGLPVAITLNVQITVLTKSVTFPSTTGTYRADIRSGIWITAGPNACASEVIDATNSKAYASANSQNANGSGFIGLTGAQITSQTYTPGQVVTFNLAVICNANSTATLNWALGSATLSPNAASFLDITPVLSNN